MLFLKRFGSLSRLLRPAIVVLFLSQSLLWTGAYLFLVGRTTSTEICASELPDLVGDGEALSPRIFEALTGRRPHKTLLWRHAEDGVHGVKLKTVTAGHTMMCHPRWLIEHWAAVDEARRESSRTKEQPKRRTTRRRRKRRSQVQRPINPDQP